MKEIKEFKNYGGALIVGTLGQVLIRMLDLDLRRVIIIQTKSCENTGGSKREVGQSIFDFRSSFCVLRSVSSL